MARVLRDEGGNEISFSTKGPMGNQLIKSFASAARPTKRRCAHFVWSRCHTRVTVQVLAPAVSTSRLFSSIDAARRQLRQLGEHRTQFSEPARAPLLGF